jgi:ribonuclease D
LDYAANDVKYLAEMTEIMSEKLMSLGRLDWCLEDCRRLQQSYRSVLAPWERIPGIGKLETRSFTIAVNIAVWRDDKAKEMNLPRGWVFSDKQILSIAVEKPKTLKQLSSILNDKSNILRKFSENLLKLVDSDSLVSSLSAHRREPLSISQRKRAKEIKKKIATIAADLDVGSSLLCTSKEVEACLRGDIPERISTGWRQDIVCDLLESI